MGNRLMTACDYLAMAQVYANRFSGCRKVTVGSVITDHEGNILSFGANVTYPESCLTEGCLRIKKYGEASKDHRLPSDCRALHSEIDALCHISGAANRRSAIGGKIYITRYPCEACARAIVAAGIKEVFYGRKQDPSEETMAIFKDTTCVKAFWDMKDDYI